MTTVVMDQAIRNRIHWYLSQYPDKYQEAKTDAENWVYRYIEGIGETMTIEEREKILQIINQELMHIMNQGLLQQHAVH